MASTIVTKNSSTASAVPLTGDLTQGELAVNVTDKKLYTKDSGGTVVKLVGGLGNQEANAVAITGGSVNGTTIGATTASTGSFTTLSASSTTTLSGGTANGVAYLNGSKVVTTGSALTFDGTNLGVGTTSPADKVVAAGGIHSTGSVTSLASGQSIFMAAYSTYGRIEARDWTGAAWLPIAISPNGGNVGIGTSSPGVKLDVSGAIRSSISGGTPIIYFNNGTTQHSIANSSGAMPFTIDGSEQMRLTSTGLGIGMSSPTQKLHVRQDQAAYTWGRFDNQSSSASAYAGIQVAAFGNTWGIAIGSSAANNNALTFVLDAGGANSEKMRLDSSGNLGLGVTPIANTRLYVRTAATTDTAYYADNGVNSGFTVKFASALTSIGNDFNNPLAFLTNNTERARIDSSGNLLVGITSASANRLYVKDTRTDTNRTVILENAGNTSGNQLLGLSLGTNTANTSSYFIVANGAGADRLYIYGNGNVVNTNNSYGSLSDVKLKENIADATPKLADLMQVRIRSYNLKSDPEHKQLGVIAQELEQVFPGMIDESPDRDAEGNDLGTTTKSVKYSVFVPMLIKAIQEQQALITQLTERITALEGK